jgi:hypothetical protein
LDDFGAKKPLTVYVLWHRACKAGQELAREIYAWFTAPTQDLEGRGLGIPVYYRSQPMPPGRPIHLGEAEHNLIVPLVDEHMVVDPDWGRDLRALANDDRATVYPVALHPGAFRFADLGALNFLRVDHRDDPSGEDDKGRLTRRTNRLRRLLTEVTARYLRGALMHGAAQRNGRVPEPLTLFLSHAKADGAGIAERLRAAILVYGQLRAFYDETDLAIGFPFGSELERQASRGSAAVLAVVTDQYATRPWCRRELGLARHPQRDPVSRSCWFVQPVVGVSALTKDPSHGIPDLGQIPLLPWLEEQLDLILDLTVREMMMATYHRLVCRSLAERYAAKRRVFVNWVPDPSSLLDLLAHWRRWPTEVVYPGHLLPRDTLERMQHRFSDVRLTTYEDLGA